MRGHPVPPPREAPVFRFLTSAVSLLTTSKYMIPISSLPSIHQFREKEHRPMIVKYNEKGPKIVPLFSALERRPAMSRTALLVFAHPDDETFTCGGSIARYADRKDTRIVLYCATRGEAGKTAGVRPDRKSTRLNSSHVKISYAVFC